MRIESKFLTADVTITSVSIEDGCLVTEGLVKKALPVKVKVSLRDIGDIARGFATPLKSRLVELLKRRLRRGTA